jgi:DMSO/TMAO reductase YedYZ heme-binding membrane subunit
MASLQRKKWVLTIVILGAAFFYAIIRYNIIKGTPWAHFPLFINNKAISLASVAFIALSYLLGPFARFWPNTIVPVLPSRKFFGLLGFGLGAVHGLMSLLLFTPANYPKFFLSDGTLNLTGELSMLFGVLAFLIFTAVAITGLPGVSQSMTTDRWHSVQRMGYAGLLLILFHVVSMGLEGWLKPSTWPGGMLPVSLVAAIIVGIALLFRIIVLISPGEYKAPQ